MERPFYDVEEDRTNLVPSLQQDAPWVQIPDVCAGVEPFQPTQQATRAYGYPHAIYDAGQGYNVLESNIMSLGDHGLHRTTFTQGLAPHSANHPYLAGTVDGFAPLDGYAADTTYGFTNAAYGTTSAAYGTGTNTSTLAEGIWPSTDLVSALMGYDYGVTNINYGVYPPLPNPIQAPGTITTVQAEHKSAVTNTDGSRLRCSVCDTTFKRASDLARHEKKHQPDRPFKCLVPGCKFKGAYRKDKLDAHVKSCHRRGAA